MQQQGVTVGSDLAKNVLQVHAIDTDVKVLVRQQLRRAEVLTFFPALPPCLVGMEASASAHHRGRELLAPDHHMRLIPPACVKPCVKRGKTDAADAEALCKAVTRPTMRFVEVRRVDQQAVWMRRKTRDLLRLHHARLTLLQHPNDLLFGKPASPHHSSPYDELTYQ